MNWRKVLGWPVFLAGVVLTSVIVMSVFRGEPFEWRAIIPALGLSIVGGKWIGGQTA